MLGNQTADVSAQSDSGAKGVASAELARVPTTSIDGANTPTPVPTPTRRIQKWQLVVAIVTVVTGGLYFVGNHVLQERRAAQAAARVAANISIQAGIQPARSHVVGNKLVPLRWYAWAFVMNNGPATSKQFFINIWTVHPNRVRSSAPIVKVGPTAADVRIVPRSMGLYQVVVTNLQPGDGFLLEQDFAPSAAESGTINKLWPGKMFDEVFTSHFITTIDISGENVVGTVDGMYKFGSIRQ